MFHCICHRYRPKFHKMLAVSRDAILHFLSGTVFNCMFQHCHCVYVVVCVSNSMIFFPDSCLRITVFTGSEKYLLSLCCIQNLCGPKQVSQPLLSLTLNVGVWVSSNLYNETFTFCLLHYLHMIHNTFHTVVGIRTEINSKAFNHSARSHRCQNLAETF